MYRRRLHCKAGQQFSLGALGGAERRGRPFKQQKNHLQRSNAFPGLWRPETSQYGFPRQQTVPVVPVQKCCALSASFNFLSHAGLVLALCLLLKDVHAAVAAAAEHHQQQHSSRTLQQQAAFMTAVLSNVQPLVETRYNWKVTAVANSKSINVPVDSNVGWPEVR